MLAGDERFAVPALVLGRTPARCHEPSGLRDSEASCDEADASSDLIPDADSAAVGVEHGGQVISLDHDFARFSSVRHTRPPIG